MMDLDLYMTNEDYKKAEANGISYANAYARFYNYGWSVERTINTPLHKPNLWPTHKELAKKHGISQGTFYDRVRKGMDPKKAATMPLIPNNHFGQKPSKISPEMKKLAQKNGIPLSTFARRVYMYKWEVERAATEPLHTSKRRKDLEATRV